MPMRLQRAKTKTFENSSRFNIFLGMVSPCAVFAIFCSKNGKITRPS